ncbi:MAG: hypothetical protein J2O49_08565, partial [Sciscionella sp.]|nr:hypothetical protein [Sciscionella sp.]
MGRIPRLAGFGAVAVITALVLLCAPHVANASVDPHPPTGTEFLGYNITPDQPSGAGHYEWIGSYRVGGKQVWCVNYLYKAPGSGQRYKPGDTVKTKWNTPIPAEQAADISYLLLRYGDTTSKDQAAALAHLLHTWTAPIKDATGATHPTQGPDKTRLAYDSAFHYAQLPASTRTQVDAMLADAKANHGPWAGAVHAPSGAQTVGRQAKWTVRVTNAAGKGIANVPVSITATDATVSSAEASSTTVSSTTKPTTAVRTGSDGTATVDVTPTGVKPSITASFASPNQTPKAQLPLTDPRVQKIVLSGGQQRINASATATASYQGGSVTVSKVDSASHKPLAGAALELTSADRHDAAIKIDGGKLVGPDGKPVVLGTSTDGTATFTNVKAGQRICVVETKPPAGYTDNFDASAPPAVCGTIAPN